MSQGASSIVGILAGAAMTAVVGNFLVQRWQHRNWFEQQRQLIKQQELAELKAIIEALTKRADARLHAMRFLVDALRGDNQPSIEEALNAYRLQLTEWNSTLRSFYPIITLHCGYGNTLSLERDVHGGFVEAGKALEVAVKVARGGATVPVPVTSLLHEALNDQAGRLSSYYQMLANALERQRHELIHGKRYNYKDGSLSQFSTRDLIKALFTSNVDGFNVVRPA